MISEIVIFDTELTTWEGALARRWMGHNERREVIEIGALKVSWPDGEVLEKLSTYVRPKMNPILSSYCIQLTGITQDLLEKEGMPFDAAFAKFCEFCGERLCLSFGNDSAVIAENIALNRSDSLNFYGSRAPNFVNIRYWFLLSNMVGSNVSSGDIWKVIGQEKPDGYHNTHGAISDCYSILSGLRYLKNVGGRLPF